MSTDRTVVGVDRSRDEAIHGRGRTAIQPVRQHRLDHGAFKDRMQRPDRANGPGRRQPRVRRAGLCDVTPRRPLEVQTHPWSSARRAVGPSRWLHGPRPLPRRPVSAPAAGGRPQTPNAFGGLASSPVVRRWASGRRLSTTLLAKRLSYSAADVRRGVDRVPRPPPADPGRPGVAVAPRRGGSATSCCRAR